MKLWTLVLGLLCLFAQTACTLKRTPPSGPNTGTDESVLLDDETDPVSENPAAPPPSQDLPPEPAETVPTEDLTVEPKLNGDWILSIEADPQAWNFLTQTGSMQPACTDGLLFRIGDEPFRWLTGFCSTKRQVILALGNSDRSHNLELIVVSGNLSDTWKSEPMSFSFNLTQDMPFKSQVYFSQPTNVPTINNSAVYGVELQISLRPKHLDRVGKLIDSKEQLRLDRLWIDTIPPEGQHEGVQSRWQKLYQWLYR